MGRDTANGPGGNHAPVLDVDLHRTMRAAIAAEGLDCLSHCLRLAETLS